MITLETSIHNPAIKLYLDKGFRIYERMQDALALKRYPMIAIMQPYFLPSPSYFQLVKTVDKFIFYDDVNFRKKSWINRNYILLEGRKHLFSIPLRNASQNKLINEVDLAWCTQWKRSFLATVKHYYSTAPFFEVSFGLLSDLVSKNVTSIADLAIASVESVSSYLEFTTIFGRSSYLDPSSRAERREQRLISITKQLGYSAYANAAGGRNLYSSEQFKPHQIDLLFIESQFPEYQQFYPQFTSGLSILDLIMFNSPQHCNFLLSKYTVQ